MSFFEPPAPPPPPPPPPRRPGWLGPPRAVIGGVLARQVVVARTDRVAVFVTRLVAYPLGFSLDVSVVARREDDRLPHMRPRSPEPGGPSDDMFRIGLLMADGSKAVSYPRPGGPPPWWPQAWEELAGSDRPPEPMLAPQGGGGGGGRWDWSYWAAPLPPPGALRLVVEWRAAGVPETWATVDADEILAAAATARPVWDD